MSDTYVAFAGETLRVEGALVDVARALWRSGDAAGVLVFDAKTGAAVDLDLSGPEEAVVSRYTVVRERGRPKLGVTPREVTLLPRHWDWLAAQPGGASATLRRLVEQASRTPEADWRTRRDAAYRFMSAMAGDRPGFEEASRALFSDRRPDFDVLAAVWPTDIARQIARYLDA